MTAPLGQHVTVTIDRPVGSRHPRWPDTVYPINYGYIEGVLGGDGQWQDAYLLGVDRPVSRYDGVVIAVIERADDCECKWVVAPEGKRFTADDIRRQTHFAERYFDSHILVLGEPNP